MSTVTAATSSRDKTEPALAQWGYGTGRVISWTPGLGAPWAADWTPQTAMQKVDPATQSPLLCVVTALMYRTNTAPAVSNTHCTPPATPPTTVSLCPG